MKKNYFFLLTAMFAINAAVAQQTCADAQEITAGNYTVDAVDGTEVPNPVCSSGGTGATAGKWYKYTPAEDFLVTVTTSFPENTGIGIDNRVQVYNGDCSSLNCVAGDDDSGAGLLCVVSFTALQGVEYTIAFDNRWNSLGFVFELIEEEVLAPDNELVTFTPQSFPGILGDYKYAVADMNGDYLDDIISVSSTSINVLFQQGDGTFESETFTTPPASYLPSWSIAVGDVNGDGFNDLLYGAGSGVSFMFSNETGTSYTHWAASNYVFSQRSNFVDLNNDGHLDAVVCHDVAPNVYYMNDGEGNLTFHQGGIGDHPTGGHYATIWFDYDNDGDVDLFISKCSGGGQGAAARFNEMHRNNGDGTFTNVSEEANMNHGVQTWSSAVNDFDNDGFMDVIVGVSSFADGGHLFMHNNGDGTFTDIATGSGWDTYSGTDIEYVSYDFNNDGFADVLTNQRLFFNNGDNTFSETVVPFGVGAIGDLNNDGFLDVQVGTTVYWNSGNDYNWVKLNLEGVESNRNAIGARIEIYGDWGKQIRDVQSGTGFRRASTLNPHFGIGAATVIDSVIVRWPSGNIDLICNPSINQTLFLKEGEGQLPVAAFSVSANSIDAEESVVFSDASIVCPNAWNWEVIPALGWEYINGTDATSENPEIQFNNYGLYTVSLVVSNLNGNSTNSVEEEIVVNSAAGLKEKDMTLFSIYPNPTNELLNIRLHSNVVMEFELSIYSLVGAEVAHYKNTTEQINVSALPSGTYFLQLKTSEGLTYQQNFVKY